MLKAILFDAYGTLFDLHSAVAPHAARLGDRADRVLALWRQKQIEYTWTATIRGAYRPFDVMTRAALDFALSATQERATDPAMADALTASFARLEPYPDAEAMLKALAARGPKLGILSNGTPDMLARLLDGRPMAKLLAPVLSVDAVKAYKPDRRVYQSAVDALALSAAEIGFVSGNAWDAKGAAEFGFDVYWINRGQPVEYGLDRKATRLSGLAELPDALV
jgi:2-haloacid dehalogenase